MIEGLADEDIVSFLHDCYMEMPFSKQGLSFDGPSVLHTIKTATSNDGCFIVEVEGGEIRGIFAAMVALNIMDHNQKRAIEYIWHSSPSLSKSKRYKVMKDLISRGVEWAARKGLFLVVSTSAEKTSVEKLLIRHGFMGIEKSHGKEPSWA